ncbi:DUF2637 domain-containing protein [Streptomyces sp. SID2131]|nr:DUF2637 domain-containing protein [Streptomyces sp. SID2131]
MSETLTHAQTPATRGAMAPAAPVVAGAAPVATPAAPAAGKSAPPAPRKGGPGWPGGPAEGVSTAPATETVAPATVATPQAETPSQKWLGRLLMAVAVVGMPLVGIIGFAASYANLRSFAVAMGLSDGGFFWSLAPWFPIGIDVSIVALLATDLVMVRRGIPWPVLRFAAHAMTLVTIVFNATADSLKTDKGMWETLVAHPLSSFGHAVMPGLFVLGVEAARKLLMHVARIEQGTATDPVPLHRWILSPVRTARLYRRMRLAAVRSYTDMVEREQALEGYRVWLKQELDGDLSKASDEQLLPLTMAPRGYTVEEALALPAKWQAEAEQRQTEEDARQAERKAQEAERQREEEDRKAEAAAQEAERKAERAIREAETAGRVRAAQARAAAAGDTAEAEAKAAAAAAKARAEEAAADGRGRAEAARVRAEQVRTAAERQAAVVAEAEESAELAEARARRAEAERRAAEDAAEAAQTRLLAERAAAEAEQLAAQRQLEEADRATAARRAAEDKAEAQRIAAEAEAEAERVAAETARIRAGRAAMEAQAQAAEDFMRLTPRQRNARRVARMLMDSDPSMPEDKIRHDMVSLRDVMEAVGASQTIAGELRTEAVALIAGGYDRGAVYAESAFEAARG